MAAVQFQLPQRFTSQPQYAAGIDPSHPRARGLVYYRATGNDVYGSLLYTPSGYAMPQYKPSRRGLLLHPSSLDALQSNVNVGPPFTVAFDLFWGAVNDTPQAMVANAGWTTGRGWSVIAPASTSKFCLIFGNVAQYSNSTADLTLNAVQRVAVVVSGNGGTAAYWLNGVQDSSRSVGTMLTPQAVGITLGYAYSSVYVSPLNKSGTGTGNGVGNVLVWNRALTDSELRDDARDTFAVFRAPSRRLWVVPSGGPVTGDATLSGTGGLTATGRLIARSNASLSGVGGITISGTRIAQGAATLSGTGGLTATGKLLWAGTATLSGTGGISITGRLIARGSTGLSGIGDLIADGTVFPGGGPITGDATLTGTGGLTATGRVVMRGAVTLGGSGTLAGTGRLVARSTVTLSGVGSLTATATVPDTGAPYRLVPNPALVRRAARNPTMRR